MQDFKFQQGAFGPLILQLPQNCLLALLLLCEHLLQPFDFFLQVLLVHSFLVEALQAAAAGYRWVGGQDRVGGYAQKYAPIDQ